MPYRQISIGKEVFVSRVSPEAVDEWLGVRERNRVSGYPDRPPDVDTPLTRAWISHPNEVNKFTIKVEEARSTFPVYSLACDMPLAEVKLLVTFDTETKEYLFRRVVRRNDGYPLGDNTYSCDEECGESVLEQEIIDVSRFAGEHPFVSTYFDFEELDVETKLALKELNAYYGTQERSLLN